MKIIAPNFSQLKSICGTPVKLAGLATPIEPFEYVVPVNAIGFNQVVAWSLPRFSMERMDCADFNVVCLTSTRQEDWLLEKLKGLYMIKGPSFKIEETESAELSQELYIQHIHGRTLVCRLDCDNIRQFLGRTNLAEYVATKLSERKILSQGIQCQIV